MRKEKPPEIVRLLTGSDCAAGNRATSAPGTSAFPCTRTLLTLRPMLGSNLSAEGDKTKWFDAKS